MSRHFKRKYLRVSEDEPVDSAFWSLSVEVLFRGYSQAEMQKVRARLVDLLKVFKAEAAFSDVMREVQTEGLTVRPFKDVLDI